MWGLDELVREGDERRTMMTVAVHARWSGQAARAAALRQFIEHAQTSPGVSFMRRCDIARWWLANDAAFVSKEHLLRVDDGYGPSIVRCALE